MNKLDYDAHLYTYESVLLRNTSAEKMTVVEEEKAIMPTARQLSWNISDSHVGNVSVSESSLSNMRPLSIKTS
jgi:hypothetical protein